MTTATDTRSLAQMQADVAAWHDDIAARRQALKDRQAARMARPNVVTEGDLAGIPLAVVSPVSEATEPVGSVGGYRGDTDTAVSIQTRRIMTAGRIRAMRRETMRRARAAETARRASLTTETTETADTIQTPDTYIAPDASEWRGVPLRTLAYLADDDPADEWGCRAILSAFETAYAVRQAQRASVVALMTARAADRPAQMGVARRTLVNGQESRHTARWQASETTTTECVSIIGGRRHTGTDGVVRIVGGRRSIFRPAPRETNDTTTTTTRTAVADETTDRLRAIVAHLTAGTD